MRIPVFGLSSTPVSDIRSELEEPEGRPKVITNANVPNLDGMSADSLMDFWARHQNGRHFREIFPEGGKGARRAVADLACYASNKATAMNCRETGSIDRALMYEGIADRIYGNLPEIAKW